MKFKARTVAGWFFTIWAGAFFGFTAIQKFLPIEPGSLNEEIFTKWGAIEFVKELGVLQLVALILWIIPRTSTVGFILMIGYVAGALATNLTHGFTQAETAPVYVLLALLTISAYFRNPELLARLRGKSIPA